MICHDPLSHLSCRLSLDIYSRSDKDPSLYKPVIIVGYGNLQSSDRVPNILRIHLTNIA